MSDVRAPMCMGCAHYLSGADNLACQAFPRGIPAPIIDGEADHRRPFPGDHGVRFTALPGFRVVDDAAGFHLAAGPTPVTG